MTEQAPQLLFLTHKFFSIYWNRFIIMNLSSLTCSHNLMVLKLSWIESTVLDWSWNWKWNWTCVAKVNPRIHARGNRGKLWLKCINEWILNETMNEIMNEILNSSDFLSTYQKFNTSCAWAPKLPTTQPPLGSCSVGQLNHWMNL